MKTKVFLVVSAVAFSFALASCGNKKAVEAEVVATDGVEVAEKAQCGLCNNADSTTCSNAQACFSADSITCTNTQACCDADSATCKGDKVCGEDKKACGKKACDGK